ncbi:hypothetical protein OCOJLMKI_1146 [Methylobacterium iners]|uniref:Uncharacterized protein n=1 Tax=Methylobacterium iners TaxID=418707 RepID=A0ABQ4RWA8_9HYPH|nr:hypothetical protein OCOJLMKI_1146 [Methylobacterium iners]
MPHLMALVAILLVAGTVHLPARAEDAATVRWPAQGARAEIRGPFRGSDIVVSTSSRTAGAIDSMTWAGREFVNAYDHGRELQSAASFDGYGECFNPTEAGSDKDGTGATSTSWLAEVRTGQNWLQTKSQMAFFLMPGQTTPGCPKGPGPYSTLRSDYALTKRVSIGVHGIANAIEYRATFSVPRAHSSAGYEVATAYMPPNFTRFWTYDPSRRELLPLSDGPGEQSIPVILATEDGSHAMGVYSPALPQASFPNLGYGRWSFTDLPGPGNATVKWNCVLREDNLSPGDRTFICYVLIGTLDDVQAGMSALQAAVTGSRTEASQPELHHGRSRANPGVRLFVGIEPNCNSGIITTDAKFGGCATAPIGWTLARRSAPGDLPIYVSTADGPSAGVVTSNPDHRDAPTRSIGFLLPSASDGTPVYVGTQDGCNAGVASTNSAHLNCSSVLLGVALP